MVPLRRPSHCAEEATRPLRPDGPGRLPRAIRGLLLDTCNVLYDNTLWRRWVLQLLSHLGLHTSYRCFFHVWDRDFLDDVHRGRRDFCEAFQAFLLSVGLSRGQIDEVEAACQARRRQLESGARTLPGVKSTLARLYRSGYALGAIANSEHPAAEIRRRLAAMGVGDVFATVVSSVDLKQAMPDEALYRAALEGTGLPADQLAFVGHNRAELEGAAALGMSTIAFNFDADAQADVYLGRFEELLEVVEGPATLAAAG